jgi:cell division protein FtsB
MSRARIAGFAGGVVLLAMAVLGGEYSTANWWQLRRQLAEERDTLRALQVEIDSLARVAHDLETDPAAQERAAREEFGMIKNGELLYRLVPATR